MANTYNYLNSVYQELKLETKRHPTFILIVLSLLSIPLAYKVSSFSLGFLVAASAYFHRNSFRFNPKLLWPVLLYLLMVLSFSWTIDTRVTAEALLKEIPLLLVPVCFMMIPNGYPPIKQKILEYYSYGMALYAVFYLFRALVRFWVSGDTAVFFYHELVTLDVNAIHVSVYMAVAFFFLLAKKQKKLFDVVAMLLLFATVFLLSSKNIILVFSLLLGIYGLLFWKIQRKVRLIVFGGFAVFISLMMGNQKITDRFLIEYDTAMTDRTINESFKDGLVYNVSIRQAWHQEKFNGNDFFPGMAMRVFQCHIFFEMLREDQIFFTGYGLNASYPKIEQKVIAHGLYLGKDNQSGYQKNNFHNQYIQNFAELGIFGVLLLLLMLGVNLKNAVVRKDFTHISFAVLMISLFLTESFLWRQRGVTFFIMMYCVFNAAALDNAPKRNKLL